MATPVPMQGDQSIEDHITVGLAQVSAALRHQAWEGGMARNLTPTQGQILLFLLERDGRRIRVNDVAAGLCMTAATASEAVGALERKGLVRKMRATDDRRTVVLRLSAAGKQEAGRTGAWSDRVRMGVRRLCVFPAVCLCGCGETASLRVCEQGDGRRKLASGLFRLRAGAGCGRCRTVEGLSQRKQGPVRPAYSQHRRAV